MSDETHTRLASFIWSICNLPFPPASEQRAIVEYLVSKTAEIDGMISKVETVIKRLQEYRTALITAAVTGKIDVRRETWTATVNHGKPDRVDSGFDHGRER